MDYHQECCRKRSLKVLFPWEGMNVSMRRQVDPQGFRFGMKDNYCVCTYQIWPRATILTYLSKNRWQPPKAPGDSTSQLKPVWTVANDHGRVAPFLVHLKVPFVSNSGRGEKKEGKRSEWKISQICLFTPKRKKMCKWLRLSSIGKIMSSAIWQSGR